MSLNMSSALRPPDWIKDSIRREPIRLAQQRCR